MLEKFLDKIDFESYDDFMENFHIKVPENFNFGYDVVDEWARINPNKKALLWTNDQGEEIQFTFADIKRESDKAASFFTQLGIKRGDMVMLILKRRYQFWMAITGKILLLSGPTCSGKTTAARKIIDDFKKIGKNVIIVSIDDFFKERKETRKVNTSEKIDYDSVEVIDLQALEKCIHEAFHEKKMKVPIFDFLTQSRVGYNEYDVYSNDIIIFEGIQAVYPQVLEFFKGEDVTGIFINVDNDIILNGISFSRDDIRLARRIVRDRKFRGANAEFTIYLWQTVRENEDKSIYPNKNICKIQIDSFMGYELFLIKPYLIEALNEVHENSQYYKRASEIKEKFELLQGDISYDYVPKNSLYTEFLGKKD